MAQLHLQHFPSPVDGETDFPGDEEVGITWTNLDTNFSENDTEFKRFGVAAWLLKPGGGATTRVSGFSSPHAGNYSFELWVRFSIIGSDGLHLRFANASGEDAYEVDLFSTGDWVFAAVDAAGDPIFEDSGNIAIAAETFYHLAVQRELVAGTYAFFANGNRLAFGASATDVRPFTRVDIYALGNETTHFDEVRGTSDVNYSGATYTIPTQAFGTPEALGVTELIYYDRVRQFTTGTGAGDLLLGTTPDTFQSFAIVGDGEQCAYSINDGTAAGTDWEVGVAQILIDGLDITLVRLEVLASSNADDFVDFGIGPKDVLLPAPAALFNILAAGFVDHESRLTAVEDGLTAHLADTTDAHDASAISILDTANDFDATDVEGALAELQTADEADEAALTAHLADTTDAHDASAISVADSGGFFTGADVEAALQELGTTKFISRGGVVISPSVAINIIIWRALFSCTVTNVRGYRVGGTGATINARRNGANNHLASALSLTSADTWMDGGAVQNTAYAAGDKMEIMIVSVTGSPTQVAVQVDLTRS